MNEEEKKKLEKFVKKNGYNNELKDLYLREFLDQDKEYEWVKVFEKLWIKDP